MAPKTKTRKKVLALCPYAALLSCRQCPVKRICPGKTTIGDQPLKSDNRKQS
ncbi:hypothetical protein [Photobacterium sp. GSS17]|uniref:hypothetical protein n=1 Tax=Photobacterium sp. GSS17 TaxID=3020715 RepID=UPI00235E9669|nr:hypothetical protein [Photobacterium sp. GSS17]